MEASAISDSWTTVHHVALSEEDETYRNPALLDIQKAISRQSEISVGHPAAMQPDR